MTTDRDELKAAFGSFITGVTVVATTDASGNAAGYTANSFSSVSLDPPLLLVSISCTSKQFKSFSTASRFAVSILAENQIDVSKAFSTRASERFSSVAWSTSPQGSPVIDGASAWFDCFVHEVIAAGDHAILIGKVVGFQRSELSGLGYYRGGYFSTSCVDAADAADAIPSIS